MFGFTVAHPADRREKQKGFTRERIALRFAAALALVFVVAVLSASFLVQHNPDLLLTRLERSVGRKLFADRIELSFFPPGARLVNFRMADDPAFSAGDFLSARNAGFEIRLLPLLIGRVRPERITLDSPIISILRDADGRYNFAGRTRERKETGRRRAGDRTDSSEPQRAWLLPAPTIAITNGTLRYRDLTAGNEVGATRIELRLENFDWDKPFDFQLEAAIIADRPNLRFKSRIGPIADHRDYRDVPLAGELDAVDLDLGKINRSLPRLRKALPRALRFDGIYTIKELKFSGTLNRPTLKGAVTGTDASFRFE
jgi:uncharacterized protein involved in outer membrane biogenesis